MCYIFSLGNALSRDVFLCDVWLCDVLLCDVLLCEVLVLHGTSSVTRKIASQLPLVILFVD